MKKQLNGKTQLTGEKYLYALMAITLIKKQREADDMAPPYIFIGTDTGMKGQQKTSRRFQLIENSSIRNPILVETKSSNNLADYSRAYEYVEYAKNTVIYEPTKWEH